MASNTFPVVERISKTTALIPKMVIGNVVARHFCLNGDLFDFYDFYDFLRPFGATWFWQGTGGGAMAIAPYKMDAPSPYFRYSARCTCIEKGGFLYLCGVSCIVFGLFLYMSNLSWAKKAIFYP